MNSMFVFLHNHQNYKLGKYLKQAVWTLTVSQEILAGERKKKKETQAE